MPREPVLTSICSDCSPLWRVSVENMEALLKTAQDRESCTGTHPTAKGAAAIHDGTANHRVKRLRPKRAYATSKSLYRARSLLCSLINRALNELGRYRKRSPPCKEGALPSEESAPFQSGGMTPMSLFISPYSQSESASLSATRTTFGCSCRIEAGHCGVTGPKHIS